MPLASSLLRAVPRSTVLAATLALGLASRPAAAQFGSNLIVNGGAEAGAGSATGNDVLAVPGWTTSGSFTVVRYTAGGGFPAAGSPGPAVRGAHFFAGGPGAASSAATQRLNLVGDLLPQVAAGTVGFTLTGFFGGFEGQDDAASLTARFLDGSGALVGSATVGPVLGVDRRGVTGLLERSFASALPSATRAIEFTLAMAYREGSYNDAYADNLSFVLSAAPATTVPEPGTWALVGTGLAAVAGAAHRRRGRA